MVYDTRPDFLFISEAEFDGKNADYFKIIGYHLDVSGTMGLGKARLVCYVADHVKQQIPRLPNLEGSHLDVIVSGNKNLRIYGIYRGFKTYIRTPNEELKEFFATINNVCKHSGKTLIEGDFNIDPMRDANTKQGKLLTDLCLENGLLHLMKNSTRRRIVNRVRGVRLEESKIDLALSNDILADCLNFSSANSYHDFLWSKIPFHRTSCRTEKITIRDYTRLTSANVACRITGDISNATELEASQLEILNSLAPLRVIRTRQPTHIVNPRVEKLKKKRDRLYKKYKKTRNERYLIGAKNCSKSLVKMIKDETKENFQKKAKSPNVKSFWSAVNNLQGKKSKPKLALKINDSICSDEQVLSEHVATFFDNKIRSLTSNMPTVIFPDISNLQLMDDFTTDEIIEALKKVKAKMSSGHDGIPLKLAKLYGISSPETYTRVFNNIIRSGVPPQWKLARVVPVPKKGDLSEVSNYRPVSNLCSVSKIFERCLLARLEALPDFDKWVGSHQHGFRKNHSTTTCLLELKDYIASCLDKDEHCVVYSLDLSAAFDMLCPDKFSLMFDGQIPNGIMRLILDFLKEREFFVSVGSSNSKLMPVERGCPQGSVLGPVLFNLYVGRVMEKLQCDFYVSYADDSYVGNSGKNLTEVLDTVRQSIITHTSELEKIGMIVNQKKTELIAFKRSGMFEPMNIVLSPNVTLMSTDKMKALGVWLDYKLNWSQHIVEVRNKILKLLNGLKIIRRKLDLKQTMTIVTSQVFSILYYASPVWLTPAVSKQTIKEVEKLHFKSLRIVTRDYRQRTSREEITRATQRLPPRLWLRFAAATTLMKIWFNNRPAKLRQNVFENTFVKRRQDGLLFGFDNSTHKIGKQVTKNWCGSVLSEVKIPWTNAVLSNDRLRTVLKSTFYPFNLHVFNH